MVKFMMNRTFSWNLSTINFKLWCIWNCIKYTRLGISKTLIKSKVTYAYTTEEVSVWNITNKNITFYWLESYVFGFFPFLFYVIKIYVNNVPLIITLTYCNWNFDNMFCVTFANLRKFKCSMGLNWCQWNSTAY